MTHHGIRSPLVSFFSLGSLSLCLATVACSPGPDGVESMATDASESSVSSEPNDDSEPNAPERTVTEFAEFYPQTVRYQNLELHMKSALVVEEDALSWIGDTVTTSLVSIDFEVENRITATSGLGSESCLLILADGTTVDYSAWERPTLGFYETRLNTIQFEIYDEVDLRGAKLFFYESRRDKNVPLYIPLDAPAMTPEPMVIDDLEGLTFETLDPDYSKQWKFDILSARVTLNSDENGGERAKWESKLIELRVRAYVKGSSGNFLSRQFRLRVDGYSVVPSSSVNDIVGNNQALEGGVVFEVPEDTTEFEVCIDTANDEWQTVSVDLGRVSAIVDEQVGR